MKYYTGVGSRKTPNDILYMMKHLAMQLERKGYTLRSGGAQGADTAFEQGVVTHKEIYYANQATKEAMNIAAKWHPAWNKCGDYARKLHGRNAFQVLGLNLETPSKFLICWTPDGCTKHATRQYSTGGTGTAISIADAYNVEIYNLQVPKHYNIMADWLEKAQYYP